MVEGDGRLLGAEAALQLSRLSAVQIERGLTETELVRVEGQFGFDFADDHRAFLSTGLPVGRGWPDWRYGDSNELRAMLAWPVDGLLFDVRHETFWHERWGERPADPGEAMAVAREQLGGVPQMVPVYGHRYLPSGRGTFGHPVLSMYQADIVCYGLDLVYYISQEFGTGRSSVKITDSCPRPLPTVEFWSELIY